MKAFGTISAVLAAATFFTRAAADVDPIVIKGSKFFYETNGTQFFMKGIAYQQEYFANATAGETTTDNYIDPLADVESCRRDVPYLQQLGTNTIRVYAIDPTADHTECMSLLQDAGIYVIADLSSPGTSIVRSNPTWNDDLYVRYTSVIDVLANYTNVLGFFAGNEVSNNNTNTDASAFVKAAVRDMKAYIAQQNYRTIGVGYATNDDAEIRDDLADYFNCGDRADAIDFWGYNIYSWCGNSSYTESGFDLRTEEFADYDVPVFFAEYGCNQPQPRRFTEVEALYGDEMSPVWSGGIVYMYFQEVNDYGLVTVSGNEVSTLADFGYLASQIAAVTPSAVNSADYTPTNTVARSCPTVNDAWQASSDLPPTPNQELCSCMFRALSCVPNDVDEDDVGELFGIVCGLGDGTCDGITANATTGSYGTYGMCNATEQLGWVLNHYYNQQRAANNGASACDFGGSATIQSVVTPTGQCSSLISEAGAEGTGSMTSRPSGTGGSGSGGSGSQSSSGNVAPRFASYPVLGSSVVPIVAYMGSAFIFGAGMILL